MSNDKVEVNEEYVKSLQFQVEALKTELSDKNALLEKYESSEPIENGTFSGETFDFGKKTYRFQVPSFWLDGTKYTAKEAATKSDVINLLIERKVVGVIIEA